MRIVLSYGLGVDSTALLLRWLEEPRSRNFDLADLLVVTAMTGDEWPRTGVLVERHVLSRLREAGIRFAQVARAGPSTRDGIVVLSDTASPERLHLAGAYKLSDELIAAGTIPQAGGNRLCSIKSKGDVIDAYLERHAPEATRHAFGYEAEETGRAQRCAEHMPEPGRLVFGFGAGERARAERAAKYETTHRRPEFPLIEWGWDRDACSRYIEKITGVADWPKSACVYCPFALTSRSGRERTIPRFDTRPESAYEALMLERRSLCLNPRGGLIAGKRLDKLIAAERPAIGEEFERRLAEAPHSVYEVRRLWLPRSDNPDKVGSVYRDLRVVDGGTRQRCESLVRAKGHVDRGDGIERVYLLRRGESLPTREHFVVAGPAGARPKARPIFATAWEELDREQLSLLAAA
ncbi:MAG TPA: hypothetical protein VKB23_03065 [Solirubrobacterales bacterium]|nr:hypothetical protein [Solirubrobacterales bacterium]